MKMPGMYVPLDVNYISDADIRRAGPDAELLFVRGLAYCKRSSPDGLVPDFDLEIVGVGLKSVEKRAATLVQHGLWVEVEGGWQVRSWSRWNETSKDLEAKRERARQRQADKRDRDKHSSHSDVTPPSQRDDPSSHGDVTALIEGNRREGNRNTSDGTCDSDELEPPPDDLDDPGEPAGPVRADVEKLCRLLADRIEANGSKRTPVTDEWRNAARLLLDRDKRPLDEALQLIDWCQSDQFWHANILSMPKFRKQYDQLRLKSRASPRGNGFIPANQIDHAWANGQEARM